MSVTEKRETRELLAMKDFAPTTCFDPHLKPMYFDLHVLSAEAIREIGHVNSKKKKRTTVVSSWPRTTHPGLYRLGMCYYT